MNSGSGLSGSVIIFQYCVLLVNVAETCDDAVAGFSGLCEALGQHVIGSNSLDGSEKSETNLLFKLFQNSLSIIVPFANIPVALPFITRCCLPVLQLFNS